MADFISLTYKIKLKIIINKSTMEKKAKVKKEKEKIHSNMIRVLLEEQGMSQQELADISLDGNAGFLSKIINGQRRCISLPIAFKIAKGLNKTIEQVFIYKPKA
jgi:DNA-binding XRE family transcriptional regulator